MGNFTTRIYNKIETGPFWVKKTSKDPKLADEAAYYDLIPEELKVYFPRKLSHSKKLETGEHELYLERVPYHNLANSKITNWESFLDGTFNVLEHFKSFELTGYEELAPAFNAEMTIKKAKREFYKLLKQNNKLSKFYEQDVVQINGREYAGFLKLLDRLSSSNPRAFDQRSFAECFNQDFKKLTFIHGDFCFSNILCHEFEDKYYFKFVDPRGSYGLKGCYGNHIYDLAKLLHSVDGLYEEIIYDNFTFKEFNLDSSPNSVHYIFNNVDLGFRSSLSDAIYDRIPMAHRIFAQYVEGLIFIGMAARHYDNEARQLVQYCQGVKFLNEVLDAI